MTKFSVPDMHCGGCARGVEAALRQVPQVGEWRFDLKARTVEVTGPANPELVVAAIRDAGFNPVVMAG